MNGRFSAIFTRTKQKTRDYVSNRDTEAALLSAPRVAADYVSGLASNSGVERPEFESLTFKVRYGNKSVSRWLDDNPFPDSVFGVPVGFVRDETELAKTIDVDELAAELTVELRASGEAEFSNPEDLSAFADLAYAGEAARAAASLPIDSFMINCGAGWTNVCPAVWKTESAKAFAILCRENSELLRRFFELRAEQHQFRFYSEGARRLLYSDKDFEDILSEIDEIANETKSGL